MCCIETVCSPTAAKTFFFCIYNLFKVFIYLTSWIFHFKKSYFVLSSSCCTIVYPMYTGKELLGSKHKCTSHISIVKEDLPIPRAGGGGRAPFVYPSFLPLVTAHTEGFSPLCGGGSVSQGHECEGLKKETFSF